MSLYKATVIWKPRQIKRLSIINTVVRTTGILRVEPQSLPLLLPHIVPLPYSIEENIDPEEAFIASLSSCHMLFFLSIAAKKKLLVDSYIDSATGVLEKDSTGKTAITLVTLHPVIQYSGKLPSMEEEQKIHHLAHQECFIANSVKTKIEITIEAR